MKRILNVLLILAFAFNQAFFYRPVQAAGVGTTSNTQAQSEVAAPTAQPTRPARPTPTPVSTPVPTEPVATSTPDANARFPKPPQPDPVFSEQSAQRVQRGGGEITGLDGRLKMKFSADTLAEDADMWVAPVDQEHMPSTTLSGNPFQIVARGKNSKQSIHKFDQKATIELSYNPQDWGGDESFLVLYYYNESNEQWMPLPSRVDTKRHVLIATTDHLTVFDADAKSWEAARLPSVNAWQVSNFTGAATYSYPLQMPEGPGGLKPSLTLSYNSQVVDSATLSTQASWVGMGWSLDTGYIQRNMHGTPDDVNDDTFSMIVGGMSHTLLRGSDGFYHTADETFWRAQMNGSNIANNSTWTVWDKNGTIYKFEDHLEYVIFYNCHDVMWPGTEIYKTTECDESHPAWRWPMTKVQNAFGQELTYTYTHETKSLVFGIRCGDNNERECIFWADTAAYPATITYPNNRYQIAFEWGGRGDYDSSWAAQNSLRMFFERQKLQAVRVKQDSNGDGTYETVVRKYAFTYATGTQPHIFNGYHWTGDVGTLTLLKVEEYGLNEAGPLPATTFTYDADNLHLQEADNGQGGKVVFTYERLQMDDTQFPPSSTDREVECNYPGIHSWYTKTPPGGSLQCAQMGNPNQLLDLGPKAFKKIPKNLIHPGGTYRLTAKFVWAGTLDRVGQVGLYDNGTEQLSPAPTSIPADATVSFVATLPVTTTGNDVNMVVACNCSLGVSTIQLVMTRYRVTQKQVVDTSQTPAQTYTYDYAYNGAAINDAAHSAIVAANATCTDGDLDNDLCYSAAYSEFRGHSSVTEFGPDGRATTTWFHQDDERVGQVHTSQIMEGIFYDKFNNLTANNNSSFDRWAVYANPNGGTQYGVEPVMGDSALKVSSSAADRMAWINRTTNAGLVGHGKAAQFQFWVDPSSTNTTAFFFIRADGSPVNQLGFRLRDDGKLVTNNVQAGNLLSETELTFTNELTNAQTDTFHRGRWYVAWLVVSEDHLFIRIKDRDNPTVVGSYEMLTPQVMTNHLWYFAAKVYNGTVRVDEYREGYLYQLNETLYTSTNNLVTTVYPQKAATAYAMSPIHWVAPTWQKSLTFERGAASARKIVENYYDPALQANNLPAGNNVQHGNLTHTQESFWNGSVFVPYRGSVTNFNSYIDTSHYIVGLPSVVRQFDCTLSGGCYPNNYLTLLNYTAYLYDANSGSQSMGKMIGERRFLRWEGSEAYYSDLDYGYDTWGNRVSVTQHTQEGTGTVWATGGAQKSVTCYGGGTIDGETTPCTNDGYHTYPLWQKNALGQVTNITYNYALGLPTLLTDPNQAISAADYDAYGRIIKIARPGDTLASPTVAVIYHDTAIPFWTEATQKTGAANPPSVRKFYNGVGELIQTQQVGVKVDDAACSAATCTLVVSQKVEYMAMFNSTYSEETKIKNSRQTTSYAIATPAGYVAPVWLDLMPMTTITTSDVLGRSIRVETPTDRAATPTPTETRIVYSIDGNSVKTTTWDPKSNQADSWKDVWGRVVKVKAADGPVLTYGYDAADHLTSVQQLDRSNDNLLANTTTSLTYDAAGHKTQMTDPDMGTWSYNYDALGNLKWQLDARNQRICLVYDSLNRLTGKEYRSNAGNCAGTPLAVTFTYDQTTDGNKGVGRRTKMNDLSGSTTWKYDERGRLLKEFKTISGAGMFMTQWTYNPADLVATMTYPGDPNGGAGEVVTNTYNTQMALTAVAGATTYLYDATYDAAGRVTMRKYGAPSNQKLESFTYHPWNTNLGLLKQHTVAGLLDLSYPQTDGYDKNGNILKIVDTILGQTQTFTYDGLNRLTSAKTCLTATPTTCDYNDTAYSYDSYGRLTTRPETTTGETLKYTDANHIHAVTSVRNAANTADISTYAYDANGNTIARNNVPVGRVSKSYTLGYDAENRLVDVSNGAVANFIYDGDGNRVLGTVNGISTVYIGNYYETQLSPTSQRVANPGFETPGATAFSSANWTQESLSSLFPATSFFKSAWGLGVGNNGVYGQAISNLAYGVLLSDAITVVPGAQYDLRAYVRGRIDQDESLVGWQIRAFYYDANNNPASWANSAASKAISDTWQQQGGVVTVPTGATKLRIGLYAVEIAGWVAFDDVSLIRVGDSTNTNLALSVNAGYENGSGFQATNWSVYDETGGKFPATGYFRFTWGIAAPHTGSYAYAISNLAYNVLQSDIITVEANTQYDLYTYVRGVVDPTVTIGVWTLRARYYDTAGNYLSSSDVAGSSPLTSTWQRFGGRLTTPANATKIQIQLYNVMSSGWVAFDDVSLVKVGGSGTNMVVNPGFETGLAGNNDMPANWAKSGEASSSFPASSYWRGTWGVAAPYAGTYAFATGNLTYGDVKSDLIAAQANTQYDLSVYIQNYRDLNVSLGYPILRVVALNSSNAALTWAVNNTQWLDLAATNVTNSYSYQKYGGRITTPPNTVNLRIELHFGMTAGWVSFDDVSLTPVQATTIYYYAGSQRIARRTGTSSVEYLFSDHLGSSSLVTNSNFGIISQMRYTAWGRLRSATGTVAANAFAYTGQRQEAGLALDFYNARWYDPNIAHFAQADTIVPQPGSSKSWDRYAYVNNNPINFNDPTGHWTCTGVSNCQEIINYWLETLKNSGNIGRGLWEAFQKDDEHIKAISRDRLGISIHLGNMGDYNGAIVILGRINIGDGFSNDYKNLQYVGIFAHEYTHRKQGTLTSLSTMGEMDAYQVQYRVLQELGMSDKFLETLNNSWHPDKFDLKDVEDSRNEMNRHFGVALYEHEPFFPVTWLAKPISLLEKSAPYPLEVNSASYYESLGRGKSYAVKSKSY